MIASSQQQSRRSCSSSGVTQRVQVLRQQEQQQPCRSAAADDRDDGIDRDGLAFADLDLGETFRRRAKESRRLPYRSRSRRWARRAGRCRRPS